MNMEDVKIYAAVMPSGSIGRNSANQDLDKVKNKLLSSGYYQSAVIIEMIGHKTVMTNEEVREMRRKRDESRRIVWEKEEVELQKQNEKQEREQLQRLKDKYE